MYFTCTSCDKDIRVPVTQDQYEEWLDSRKYVQTAFAHLSPEHRELMISGTCAECWNTMFPPDEDECGGICLTADDIGLSEYGDMVAYAHPDCPVHGYGDS